MSPIAGYIGNFNDIKTLAPKFEDRSDSVIVCSVYLPFRLRDMSCGFTFIYTEKRIYKVKTE